jgi:hypothetical protein
MSKLTGNNTYDYMFQDMIKCCMTHILQGTTTSIFQSISKSSIGKWYSVYSVGTSVEGCGLERVRNYTTMKEQ